jgi:hypothetical protein
MSRPLVGARRTAPRTLLAPGLGSACAYLAVLVVFAVITLALKAAVVAQVAPAVGR